MRNKLIYTILLVFAVVCAFAQPVTINPPSATIQPGQSVTLTASGATYYQWSPATGLSVTEGPVTVASPTITTTYTCEGYAPGAEADPDPFGLPRLLAGTECRFRSHGAGTSTFLAD